MTKWILIALAVASVAAFSLWQRNAVKTAYINGLPEYNELPGKEYIFERDCYIFKLDNRSSSYPFVAARETGNRALSDLPPQVSAEMVGKTSGNVRILDLLRVGTRFRIVSVRRDQSRTSTQITFEILLVDEAERKYPRLDAFYILDHSPEAQGKAPHIIEEYAVERVKK